MALSSPVVLQPDFVCGEHGVFCIRVNRPKEEIPETTTCPQCDTRCSRKEYEPISGAPSLGSVYRSWNENANEMRRDPMTQAKYQAQHMQDEQRDMGNLNVPKITDEGLQVAAARIDADNKGKIKRTSPEERAKQGALRTARKNKEKRNL